jgi:hypothetical protein
VSHAVLAGLGIASGVVMIIGIVPYVRDIFHGTTKPERATWWVWTLLNVLSLSAQIGAHAGWSLLMTIAQGLVTLLVAMLSIWRGYGRFHRRDLIALLVACLGAGLWWLLKSPLAALIIVVLVDVNGFWLTISKTWKAPQTETLSSWALSALSGLLGMLAVGSLNFTQFLYPLYITLGNLLLVTIIVWRRRTMHA